MPALASRNPCRTASGSVPTAFVSSPCKARPSSCTASSTSGFRTSSGYANGGAVSGGQLDDNNNKDVYFRIARKWFGYPLDGVIGQAEIADSGDGDQDSEEDEGEEEEEDETGPEGLDFWRAWGFETGLFGWFGEAEIPNGPVIMNDRFRRIGVDARLQWFDLDVYGVAYWAQDDFAGLKDGANLGQEEFFSYMIQCDYTFKPWIVGYVRYEETRFDESARRDEEEARVVSGMVFLIRQNMKLQTEFVHDTTGMDTGGPQATDQIITQLDFAY